MTLDQLIDITKRTFPNHGLLFRWDPSDKEWLVNIFDLETRMPDWKIGQHKFPVKDRDPLRALAGAYSWASAWLIEKRLLVAPPDNSFELIKKGDMQ